MACAVILTALPVEYLAVRKFLTGLREVVNPLGTVYEQGVFAGEGFEWSVGIAEVGAGNAGAAIEAERAIGFFKPDVLLFVGIAGGLKDDVKIGDVVAATKVYGYESGKVAVEGFLTRPVVGNSSAQLVARARAEARKDDWRERLSSSEPLPEVFVGAIAAGEKVVAAQESQMFKFLRSNYNDALAVEMEGYGVLNAAFAYPSIKSIVIRGISDMVAGKNDDGGQGKEVDRHVWASNHASAFAFELLAKFKLEKDLNNQFTIYGDYVLVDKVMGYKVSGDKINSVNLPGNRSISLNNAVQDAVIITGDRNQVNLGVSVLSENQAVSGSRRSFYERQLARKRSDLDAVEMQLAIVLDNVSEGRLKNHAEQLLMEIEQLDLMLGQQLPILALDLQDAVNQQVASSIADLKLRGEPIYYARNGKLIRENADGRKFEYRLHSDGTEELLAEVDS
jgi:nucleoside phosphorylase